MAARVGSETFVQVGVAIDVTGMITHSNVCNLKDNIKKKENKNINNFNNIINIMLKLIGSQRLKDKIRFMWSCFLEFKIPERSGLILNKLWYNSMEAERNLPQNVETELVNYGTRMN